MKSRGILFSAPMVRALLAGTKTVTRRIVRELPGNRGGLVGDHVKWFERGQQDPTRWCGHDGLGSIGWIRCPYGEPGDRLWVRETHAQFAVGKRKGTAPQCVAYRATCDADGGFDYVNNGDEIMRLTVTKWTPAIHMPRWASRIELDVVSVRVERLHEITNDDAAREGVRPFFETLQGIGRDQRLTTGELAREAEYRAGFALLWDEINGNRALWIRNPWVWRVEFKRVEEQLR